MITAKALQSALDVIQKRAPDFTPKVGIVLGSGLGDLAHSIENRIELPYEDIPGMPVSSVAGHVGCLVLGYLEGVPVACLKGRVHYYEGASSDNFKMLIRVLKAMGCQMLLLTNAAGSLRREVIPGDIVMITDHINFQFKNPLIGLNAKAVGDRFFPMDDAYDRALRERWLTVAGLLKISLHQGIYCAMLGPNFETPAEIRALRLLGADVVGMSTVPEVLVARHCGLRVSAFSVVTNLSADMSEEQLTHALTLKYAKQGAEKLCCLVKGFLKNVGPTL
jgi:xanthosine phosphorylase